MKELTFKDIEDKGLLIYRYYRGSHAYGLEKPDGTSDWDEGAVYVAPNIVMLGLEQFYQPQIADERNDVVWYEVGKWMEMLLKSNPNMLEALFVDDKFVIYEHPIMTELKKHKQKFLTKKCFNALIGYSYEQIKKARGLKKKIVQVNDENYKQNKQHKHPLDFCYTFYKQGSTEIKRWLDNRHLKQRYCGLTNIPNMNGMYGVYYDWGQHCENENDWENDDVFIDTFRNYIIEKYDVPQTISKDECIGMLKTYPTYGYRGIVGEEDDIHIEEFTGKPKIFDVRLSSIENKEERSICEISYNSIGYSNHCREFKELKEWEEKRNPERFKENLGRDFDCKNIAHSVRLLHMGIEIAKDGKFIVNRTGIDRDFILNIRLGNTDYDTIINYIEGKKDEMEQAMAESTLPDDVDINWVNKWLLRIRKEFNV